MSCPRCKISLNDSNILRANDGSDNILQLEHKDVLCSGCGYRFNVWGNESLTKEKIGAYYSLYQ